MRTVLFALAFGAAMPALADDLAQPPLQGHDLWRSSPLQLSRRLQPTAPQPPTAPPPRFTMTYTAGVARRLGLDNGNLDMFEHKLGGSGAPGIAAGVQNGTAKIELRWHPGE
ncbi:MAG: hypothetical protein JO261_00735 [Alphaproteobacteria bacterium]|nr:hypothetical protein [Alphaproteobacteria bacterium]MBV9692201.1 hypothetical protein [Alphaproteobacteria bacterium]